MKYSFIYCRYQVSPNKQKPFIGNDTCVWLFGLLVSSFLRFLISWLLGSLVSSFASSCLSLWVSSFLRLFISSFISFLAFSFLRFFCSSVLRFITKCPFHVFWKKLIPYSRFLKLMRRILILFGTRLFQYFKMSFHIHTFQKSKV